MKFKHLRHSRSGFTLAELILAISIMMIMGTMTILVYFNVSETSRRLQLSREVSESARQITERIAQEVKQNGITINPSNIKDYNVDFLKNYKNNTGNNILAIAGDYKKTLKNGVQEIEKDSNNNSIRDAKKYFIYWQKVGDTITEWCSDTTKHCGLYLWENGQPYNLVDAFREDKKRVTIQDLKFYVTGGDNSANKVTLKMTLALSPQAWVSANLANSTKLEIQTTFSERPYKIN